MIDTKSLREKLENILAQPITATSNDYLKHLVNYSNDLKLANLNYLILQIPNDFDGIVVKSIFEKISNYLSGNNIDTILVKLLSCENLTINDLISSNEEDFRNISTTSNVFSKVKTLVNGKSLILDDIEIKKFIEYDISSKEIIDHIVGDAQ